MSGATHPPINVVRHRWTGSISDALIQEIAQPINCRCVPIPGLSAAEIAEWERVLGGKVIR